MMSKFLKHVRNAQPSLLGVEPGRQLEMDQILGAVGGGHKPGPNGNQVVATKAVDAVEPRVSGRKLEITGRNDRLISDEGTHTDLAGESYRVLRTRLMRLQHLNGLSSVVISSAAPHEGKTLTAMNMALCCSQIHDARVLVVDADLRSRGLTRLLGDPDVPGVGDVLANRVSPEEAVLSTDIPNLYAVLAGRGSMSPAELLSTPRWKEFMQWGRDSFKLVVVDSAPILLTDFELVAAGCDGVLIVVRALHTSRELLEEAVAHVESRKLLGAIFNATEYAKADRYYRNYYRSGGRK
jgi:capsular exopolysaccharide synthesis family protein